MIPVKLKLHNFMCYKDNVPELNFDGFQIATISGDNGNGKSAIIDAITWALWGKARSRSDDDLVHSTENYMEVEFEFVAGKQHYRVLRKRSKPKNRRGTGQSSLDLFIASDGTYNTISGERIRDTQQKIIDILHMDYSTFINSAFLRQGHADQFTVADAAQRKKILADILRLNIYDDLETRAKELTKDRTTEANQLAAMLLEIDNELVHKSTYMNELHETESELSNLEILVQTGTTEVRRLQDQKESLERNQSQLMQLKEQSSKLINDKERWHLLTNQHQSNIEDYEALISQRSYIEAQYKRLREVAKDNQELDERLSLLVKLIEQKNKLGEVINSAQNELLTNHTRIEAIINQLKVKADELPLLRVRLKNEQSSRATLDKLENDMREKRHLIQQMNSEIHYLTSHRETLQKESQELDGKLTQLTDQTDATCPLCGRELTTDGHQFIMNNYITERKRNETILLTEESELAKKGKERLVLENELAKLVERFQQHSTSQQIQFGSLMRQIQESEDASKQIKAKESQKLSLEEHLTSKNFALKEQAALKQVEDSISRLDYDSTRHDKVRQELASLEMYRDLKRKLEEALGGIDHERMIITQAREAVIDLDHRLATNQRQMEALELELEHFAELGNELQDSEAKLTTLSEQLRQSQEKVGSLKANLERCIQLEKRRKDRDKRLTKARKDIIIYQELVEAFGKKGIQALLIESAIPEIEAEANQLLGKMTDYRMNVKFETQKETKKGDVIETLDIRISDELGMRDYEMFSGGEAFRINLAIRIALSRLLARRAGAPLPTLIIDEGFGTQDNTGIEKLKEAITSIQGDFQKILVITHIGELRDAFPVRINVFKTAAGSAISFN